MNEGAGTIGGHACDAAVGVNGTVKMEGAGGGGGDHAGEGRGSPRYAEGRGDRILDSLAQLPGAVDAGNDMWPTGSGDSLPTKSAMPTTMRTAPSVPEQVYSR